MLLFQLLNLLSLAIAQRLELDTFPQGVFLQEQPSVNANPPDYVSTSLGLIPRQYPSDPFYHPDDSKTQWKRLAHYVEQLNDWDSIRDYKYKVFFLARHGEAYHNVAEKYYGTECWNCYWSQKDGNGSVSWKDARLTPKGHEHALKANRFWKEAAKKDEIPFPEILYTSPLWRCVQTANFTFADNIQYNKAKGIVVTEEIREPLNGCTCAWRSPLSKLQAAFSPLTLKSSSMADQDLSWIEGKSETQAAQELRVTKFLGRLIDQPETFISVTSHGALIKVFLKVVGYPNPEFNLTTGQILPVIVRMKKVAEEKKAAEALEPGTLKKCSVCGPGS